MKIFRVFPRAVVYLCFTFAAYGLGLGAGTAQAQTFVNGGFEADNWTPPYTIPVSPTGWNTVISNDGEWPYGIHNTVDTTHSYTPFGTQFIALCARDCSGNPPNSSISQTVSGFVVGQQYQLNFQQSPEVHDNPPIAGEDAIVNVSIAGGTPASTNFSAQSVAVLGRDWADWKAQSLVFTANATTLTFTFTGVANVNSDTESGIDEVSVTALNQGPVSNSEPVPTVPIYGLVLSILGLLLVAERRLRSSAKRK